MILGSLLNRSLTYCACADKQNKEGLNTLPCGYGFDKTACTGCCACLNICPQGCIRMVPDAEGFDFPDVDRDKCISCGRCGIVCPVCNMPDRNKNRAVVYECKGARTKAQPKSAPVSILNLLSSRMLSDGGVVFGSRFNENFEAVCGFTEEMADIAAFEEPKYVQSRIENAYMKVQEFLKAERPVLFSGTPCQIAGLVNYLNGDYEGLICVAQACGGVASPKAFRQYLGSLERIYGARVKRVTFRDTGSTHCGTASVYFENGASYGREFMEDAFLRGTVKGLYLRPSCHTCTLKNVEGIGDIILFSAKQSPRAKEADSDKAVSSAIVNTQKGERLFARAASKIECSRTQPQGACRDSPFVVYTPAPGKNRKRFFEDIEDTDFAELVMRLTAPARLKKAGIFLGSLYKGFKKKAARALRLYRAKIRSKKRAVRSGKRSQ